MRRDTAITVFVLLVVGAMLWVFFANRIPETASRYRDRTTDTVRPKRSIVSGASLLSVSPLNVVSPSPLSKVSPESTLRSRFDSAVESPLPPEGTLCGWLARMPAANAITDPRNEETLVKILREKLPDDPDAELFSRLSTRDYRGVIEADRDIASPSAQKIALLARLGFLDGDGFESGRNFSIDLRDLEDLEAMQKNEPQNGFWALAVQEVRKREGIGEVSENSYDWATSKGAYYEDPVQALFAKLRRKLVQNDEGYLSFLSLYTRAAITNNSIYQMLRSDILPSDELEKSESAKERNAAIDRVGRVMTSSQYDQASHQALEGFTGSMLDAYIGEMISSRARAEDSKVRQEILPRLKQEFKMDYDFEAVQTMNKMISSGSGECDEDAYLKYLNTLRNRVKSIDRGTTRRTLVPSPEPLGNAE